MIQQARGQNTSVSTARAGQSRSRWVLILAGGEGERMRPMIEQCLGEPRPKQFCAFTGSRSMLQHTADRATKLVPERRIVTVLCKGHQKYLSGHNGNGNGNGNGKKHPGSILEQPLNRGTAPGVFFGLAYISQFDPHATVLVLPSDHFVHPESKFLHYLENAFRLAERDLGENLLLLGVSPKEPEEDYGWIEPEGYIIDRYGPNDGVRTQTVKSLHEKPEPSLALQLFHRQCLWNTMIVAGKVETFWRLLDMHLPRTSMEFRLLQPALCRRGPVNTANPSSRPLFSTNGAGHGKIINGILKQPIEGLRTLPIRDVDWCGALYRGMGVADFSADLLQRESEDLRVLLMEDVDWCDWGRPNRVMATLRKIGARPSSPFQALEVLT